MLLTITCNAPNASDLGFLLHKNPATLFEKPLSFGTAHIFYTEASDTRCTVHLQVTVDPVALVRGKGDAAGSFSQYVSDRPYTPSSFLSVAMAECFGTALGGRSKERPERVTEKMPLVATVFAVSASPQIIRGLFAPLGYALSLSETRPLDERFPEWGNASTYDVTLHGETTVRELLSHLYLLIPALDAKKHYFIGDDEVEKLLSKGEGWLATHPAREWITRQYLIGRRGLAQTALARLAEVEAAQTPEQAEESDEAAEIAEETLEKKVSLNDLRIAATVAMVRSLEPAAKRVIDLGCGEGKTMAALLAEIGDLEHVAGMDVATVPLAKAARRLHLDRLTEREKARVSLFQGSLVYRDARTTGYDVALLNEVIEHLDRERLATLERVVFAHARPRRVIVTTPNADYNSVWESLPAGKFRHADHRFEWTRAQFGDWAKQVGNTFGYTITFSGIGEEDTEKERGNPTQMATFDRT